MKDKMISISVNKVHYTNAGIKENKAFGVNIPSEELVLKTDYVDLVSGKKNGQVRDFRTLLRRDRKGECPLNMECRLYDTYDTPTHDLFIGEVVETYAEETVLSDSEVDISKVKPLLFDMASTKYWSLGSIVASCWSVGKQLK